MYRDIVGIGDDARKSSSRRVGSILIRKMPWLASEFGGDCA